MKATRLSEAQKTLLEEIRKLAAGGAYAEWQPAWCKMRLLCLAKKGYIAIHPGTARVELLEKGRTRSFVLGVPVKEAHGTQSWRVDAASFEEALQKYKDGEGDLVNSDVEVTSLDEDNIELEAVLETDEKYE